MIIYIASSTYQNIIATAVRESGQLIETGECVANFVLKKYVNENYNRFASPSLECFVIDITALEFIEEEVLQTLDSIRTMNDRLRIILVAANRSYGDRFLKKCAQMGIYNLIVSDDFNEIKNELLYCIQSGKQYKDAVKFIDYEIEENIVVKTEIKQTVNKVILGLSGSQPRIGVTHYTIMLATYLRKRGYMIAIVEYNAHSEAFKSICESAGCKYFSEEGYFNFEGIDYYPSASQERLAGVIGKCYNFILIDFGEFSSCDQITYNKSDVKFILAGAKPWEVEQVNKIFSLVSKETLATYQYIFNFTDPKDRKDIEEGMSILNQVYFIDYAINPFIFHELHDVEHILKEFMPVKVGGKKKKGLFRKK